ncbi:MAG TPA: S8 family serine peptidase [Dokdonella sp.]|uniref:S8 family serine peptidase n=1 Tax=Dokdonella sp. TaxID=2291710 RepID=UPI002D7F25D2|nr:S8 family serine peptidase [Dokdonella sp.]HET9032574.1 S8 family serine peptidase [Dokdonella sp.]
MKKMSLLAAAIAASCSVAYAADIGKIVIPAGVPVPAGYERIADYGSFSLYRGNLASVPRNAAGAYALNEADVLQFDRLRLDTQQSAWTAPSGFSLKQPSGSALQIIQFVGPLKQEWLDQVRATGAVPVQYVESNGYLVWANQAARTQLSQMADTRTTLQFSKPLPSFVKLGTSLFDRLQASEPSSTRVPVTVQLYRHAGSTARRALEAMGLKSDSDWESILAFENAKFSVTLDQVRQIIELPDVYWVGEVHKRELNDEVQSQIIRGYFNGSQSGPLGAGYLPWLDALGFPSTAGAYPVVDITDDGIGNRTTNSGDPTLHELGQASNPSRLVYNQTCGAASANGTVEGHGHINANIALGYDLRANASTPGARFPGEFQRGLGMNPYGRIGGTRIFNSNGNFDESACGNTDTGTIKASYTAGARISSNSWGCSSCASQYDDGSQAYDVGTRDADLAAPGNQELITVFAAGNSGSGPGTVGTPGNGKNMITVGASENQRPTDENGSWTDGCQIGPTGADNAMDVISFSSRGPAPGTRIKPEVIAPGTHITGTRANPTAGSSTCDAARPVGNATYAASSGTSHSTPAISGVASLVWWWIANGQGALSFDGATPSAPSPALMKAWLMAFPTYLTGVAANGDLPSNTQGYGMPNLGDMFSDTPTFVVNQTQILDNTGEVWTWVGAVADPAKPLRITLAYTDAAGAIGTSPQVNNLDLEVDVGATTYLGNRFSGQWSTTGGSADNKNNYEAVFLPSGTDDTVTIRIKALNIAGDGVPNVGDTTDQDFAVVCNNCAQNPTFTMAIDPVSVSVCTASTSSVPFNVSLGSILGFNTDVSLVATGNPAGTTTAFSTNPVSLPGNSSLTIGNLASVAAGPYSVDVTGTAGAEIKARSVALDLVTANPDAFVLTSPADASANVDLSPTLTWDAAVQASTYQIEIATDAGFSNVIYTSSSATNSHVVGTSLDSSAQYYWRVTAQNECGETLSSSTFAFTTLPLPGDCSLGSTAQNAYSTDFEGDNSAWTSSGTQNTWAETSINPHSGSKAFLAADLGSVSDQRLVSPAMVLPTGQTPLSLLFWNRQLIEDRSGGCFDGAILEISTDSGSSWTQITNADLLVGQYQGPISTSWDNPLGGLDAWCGDPQEWQRYVVSLDAYAGQTVNFRFRMSSDRSVGRAPDGFALDDVKVQGCAVLTDEIFADGFELTP